MRHLLLTLSAGLLLPACSGVNEDNFVEKFSKELCKIYDECYRGDFLEHWDDVDACVDELVSDFEDADYSDCTFDEDNAKDCLDSLKKTECGDMDSVDEEACDGVWEC